MRAVSASGESSMSEASMLFHPAIDEPSKAWPLSNLSCVNILAGTCTCCSLPRVSVKRRSTNLTSLSLRLFSTSAVEGHGFLWGGEDVRPRETVGKGGVWRH